jgi:hypothetical protein
MSATEGGPKLCKDCKHLSDWLFSDCMKAPKGRCRVDGRKKYETASLQRDYWNIVWWRCGRKGRFWELKERDVVGVATEDWIDRRVKSMKSERGLK